MKHIFSFCLLVLILSGCSKPKEVAPDQYLKSLYLLVEPTANGFSLGWGSVFVFEEGMSSATPVAPAQYEIYVSDTDANSLQKVATVDGTVQSYVLGNQSAGKTLYAQVKAIHPSLTASQSPVVTTNVGALGSTDLLFPNATPAITFGCWGGSTLLYTNSTNNWVLQAADGTTRTLKGDGFYPVLSPDGRSVAYLSNVNTNTSYATQLFVRNLESGATRLLETKQAIYSLEWSGDSGSIAFIAFSSDSNTGVWLRKLSDNASTSLYIPPVGPNQLRTDQLDWSPDGQSVVVSQEAPQQGQAGTQLLKIPTSGGSPQVILTSNWQDKQPAYSPDGTRLAFISTRSGYAAIWLYEPQTGKLRQLTGSAESFYFDNRLDWKNNRQLTYTAPLPSLGNTSLKVVTLPN